MKYIATKIKGLFEGEEARSLIRNMSFMVFENILKLFLGFFVSIWIARSLGPNNYGHYSYVLSFCMIFSPFYTMGIDDISIKDFVRAPSDHNEIIGTSALVKLSGGIVGIILSNLFLFLINPEESFVKWGVLIYSIFQLLKVFDVICIWYLAEINIKKITIGRNVILIFTSLIKIYFLFLKSSWFDFILVSCLDLFLTFLVYLFIYKRDEKSISKWGISLSSFKVYFVSSFPLFIITLFSVAIGKVDQIMIGEILGADYLGKYAVAVRLVDLWYFIPLAVISTLFPRYIKKNKIEEQESIRNIMIFLMLLLGISFALIVSLISPFLVNSLYGTEYIDSSLFLTYYSWLAVFVFLTFARGKIFLVEGNIKDGAYLAFANLVLNIVLNIIFIPMWGVLGAIWASIISYILSDIILSIFNKNIRRNFFYIFESVYYMKKRLFNS